MGTIAVHEFITLDGVIQDPFWTFDYPFDDLHLFVFPLTLGVGQRLFADGGPVDKFALAGSEAYDSGVVHLTYTHDAPGGA